jgi:hypothetical protein
MRRRLPFVLVVLLAAGLTGCGTGLGLSSAPDIYHVNWISVAGRDLPCHDGATMVGAAAPTQYHDIDEDGWTDAFVAMRCAGSHGPDQLEAFAGKSDMNDPTLLDRLTWIDNEIYLDGECLFFMRSQVVIFAHEQDAAGQPTASVSIARVWDKQKRKFRAPGKGERTLQAATCA